MLNKILITAYIISFPYICFSQLENASFEEWEEINSILHPVNWKLVYPEFCDSADVYAIQSMDAMDGDYSLKLSATCVFWEGGMTPNILEQTISPIEPVTDYSSALFSYKLINIDPGNFNYEACATITISFYYSNAVPTSDLWELKTNEESTNWTLEEIPLNNINPDGEIDSIKFRIRAGGCPIGFGYGGNSDFIIDNLVLLNNNVNTSATLDQQNIKVFPNPTDSEINIFGIENKSLEIFNSSGELIFTESKVKNSTFSFKFDCPGIYLVKIQELNKGQFVTKKIIVN